MLEEAANVDLLLRLELTNQALNADVRARPSDARATTTENRRDYSNPVVKGSAYAASSLASRIMEKRLRSSALRP